MRQPKVGDLVVPTDKLFKPAYKSCLLYWKKGINIPLRVTRIHRNEIWIENCEISFTNTRNYHYYLKIIDTMKTKLLKEIKDGNS